MGLGSGSSVPIFGGVHRRVKFVHVFVAEKFVVVDAPLPSCVLE